MKPQQAASAGQQSSCVFHIEHRGGRNCESCALSLEKQLEETPGVRDAAASFRTGLVRIEFDPNVTSTAELERAVHEAGPFDHGDLDEVVARSQLRREAVFVGLTLAGLVGGLVSGWVGASQLVTWGSYGVAYVFGGWYGLKGALETLRYRAVDIDLLMILAALGALSIGAPFEGAMLLFLFSLSNTLQDYAIGRSRRAIRSLVQMRPESAQVLREGREVTVPIEAVAVGDRFVVRPGDRIPLDGVVESGESTVDQSSLTGESAPVAKGPGDEVYGGTITENGSLEVRVTRRAQESAIARLIQMVEEAQSEKAPTQRLIDRLEQPYVLGVFGLTALAIAVPLALGNAFETTFYRAMTLMVAASPCAVIISTPAAVLSAIAAAARNGVLFKGGEHVESAAAIRVVAFDKTGTLTEGEPTLTDVGVRDEFVGDDAVSQDQLLSWAAAVQARSEHHLARATLDAAHGRSLDVPEAHGFHAVAGKGVRAVVGQQTVHIGNRRYFEVLAAETAIDGLETGLSALQRLQDDGKTSVLVAREADGHAEVLGWLAFTDTVRPGAAEMVRDLRALGVEHIVMLTGDNDRVAHRIAAEAGIDEVRSELLPEEKVSVIDDLLTQYGTVAMVGDGVNDAPALATATLGVAMGGAGTDVALETSDVVLMADDLSKIPYVLGLGRKTRRTLLANFTIALLAIVVMVVTIVTTGLPLPLAVVGHEGSTVIVSLNGLRLLGFRG